MAVDDVELSFEGLSPLNKFHMRRFFKCFKYFAKDLKASNKVEDILQKYEVFNTDKEDSCGLEFPKDFDQGLLPEDLRKENKPKEN